MQRLRGRTDILYYMQRGRGSWLWDRWALDQAVCYGPCYFGLSRMVAEEVEGSKLWRYHCLKKKLKRAQFPLLTAAPGDLLCVLLLVCWHMSWNLSFPPPTRSLTLCKQTAIFILQIASLRSTAAFQSRIATFFLWCPCYVKAPCWQMPPAHCHLMSEAQCLFSSSDCFPSPSESPHCACVL